MANKKIVEFAELNISQLNADDFNIYLQTLDGATDYIVKKSVFSTAVGGADYHITMNTGGDINITPNARKTIIGMNTQLTANATIIADLTNCLFGDELVFVLKSDATNRTVNFPVAEFFISGAGIAVTAIGTDGETLTAMFYFDGDRFINTFDHY